jgi:hypothetical protein
VAKYRVSTDGGNFEVTTEEPDQEAPSAGGSPLLPGRASVPPSPVAKELSGPEPSFAEKVGQNLPMSLARLPARLTANTPGMPYSGSDETLADPHHLPDYVQGVKDYGNRVAQAFSDPAKTIANDPAGAVADMAGAVSGFGRSGGAAALKEGAKTALKPATLASGGMGSYLGSKVGGKTGAEIGGAIGLGAPVIAAGAKEFHAPGLIRDAGTPTVDQSHSVIPATRQLNGGPIITPPPADTSGTIRNAPGPTILPNESGPIPEARQLNAGASQDIPQFKTTKERSVIPAAYASKSNTGMQIPQVSSARDAIAQTAAEHLYRTGITPDQIRALPLDTQKLFWNNLSQMEGLSPQKHYSMSADTIDATMGKLVKMSKGGAVAPPSPQPPPATVRAGKPVNGMTTQQIAEQMARELATGGK